MAGAISGARLGISGIPTHLIDSLEEQPKGRSYLAELAKKLHQRFSDRPEIRARNAARANVPKHR